MERLAGFGRRVMAARLRYASDHQQKLNQADLAVIVGVEQGTVSRWESGSLPDVETVVKIADALGVRVGWLLVGEEPMHQPNGLHVVEREMRGGPTAPIIKSKRPAKAKVGRRKNA